MKIFLYSDTTSKTVEQNLGRPEYSYYFVLKEFLPVLERIGETIVVEDPEREVDVLYDQALAEDEPCIFLSFSPPHKTPTDLRCPTVPIFAWEFNTIPTEAWGNDPHNDWRLAFGKLGRAITHSEYAAGAVRAAMGPDFPVFSIPAPVWDRFAKVRSSNDNSKVGTPMRLKVDGDILDSREIDLPNLDPLTLKGPNRILNYEYAVSVIRERDAQLKQRNEECAYAESLVKDRDCQLKQAHSERIHAESIVKERDALLKRSNAERAYAESIVKERDAQLERSNAERAYAEQIVKERDDQIKERNAELEALLNTVAGKLAKWLLERRSSRHNEEAV